MVPASGFRLRSPRRPRVVTQDDGGTFLHFFFCSLHDCRTIPTYFARLSQMAKGYMMYRSPWETCGQSNVETRSRPIWPLGAAKDGYVWVRSCVYHARPRCGHALFPRNPHPRPPRRSRMHPGLHWRSGVWGMGGRGRAAGAGASAGNAGAVTAAAIPRSPALVRRPCPSWRAIRYATLPAGDCLAVAITSGIACAPNAIAAPPPRFPA
jgi:hypothetical protein